VTRRALFAVGAGVALLFTALFLAMTASAAKSAPAANKTLSCYPDNQFQLGGDTSADLHHVKVNSTFEIEPTGDGGEEIEAEGTVGVNMWFKVVDDTLTGYATANFKIGKDTKVKFESRCVQEVETEEDDVVECVDEDTGFDCPFLATDQFEAEFEGLVKGLPFSQRKQPAVLTLSGLVNDDTGEILLKAGIEQGKTCDENGGEIGSSNEDDPVGLGDFDFEADNTDAFLWGVPEEFDASEINPCQDVFRED
jgi:hypothetical protein